MDLYLIHFIFIVTMSSVSFLWGEYTGYRKGQTEMLIDLIQKKLVTENQLRKKYNIDQ
jgi:hypothetical protein